MSFAKHPTSRVHLVVLALCVAACLWNALGAPEDEADRPEDDAAVLVRGVLGQAQQDASSLPPSR